MLGGNCGAIKFEGEQFGKDLQAIEEYYHNNGYAKAHITKQDVQLNDEKKTCYCFY